MVRFVAAAVVGLYLIGVASGVLAQDRQKNQLVAFRSSEMWEARCLNLGGTGRIACNIDNTLVYKSRPDFRAQIFSVFLERDGTPYFFIEYERQTRFNRAYIEVDGGLRVSLANCERPCTLKGPAGAELVAAMTKAKRAVIHFHDLGTETFAEEIELTGFAQALAILREMDAQYATR